MKVTEPILLACLLIAPISRAADEKPATTRSSAANVKITLVGDSTVTEGSEVKRPLLVVLLHLPCGAAAPQPRRG